MPNGREGSGMEGGGSRPTELLSTGKGPGALLAVPVRGERGR